MSYRKCKYRYARRITAASTWSRHGAWWSKFYTNRSQQLVMRKGSRRMHKRRKVYKDNLPF